MILRVGGHLSKHKISSFDCEHSMFISKNHPLTEAIIRYLHLYSLHAGPEQSSFLYKARRLRKCFRCIRISVQPLIQLISDYPHHKLTLAELSSKQKLILRS